MKLATPFALLLALGACGDDPVELSQPVGINLKAKSSDTQQNTITEEKGITTESGNPYGAFVAAAKDKLAGKSPSRIAIDKATLFLGGSSTGVTKLGEVFTGNVDVVFVINDSNNSVPAASGAIDATTGAGPVDLDASFDSDTLTEFDYLKLLGGGFKVVLRGPAATGFMAKGADADLQVTFTFTAFE